MKNKIEIRSFVPEDIEDFRGMFTTYFRDDFGIKISDEDVVRLCGQISRDIQSGILYLDLLTVDGSCVGFINSQVDSPKSDWCEREGWGFIREMYVHKTYRRQNLGLKMVSHCEEALYKRGIEKIYLTSDNSGHFWTACGYTASKKKSQSNDHPIYEKFI